MSPIGYSTSSVASTDTKNRLTETKGTELLRSMRIAYVKTLQKSTDGIKGNAFAGFNAHRRYMVRHKLPRDPVTNTINGSIIASWSWIGWPSPPTQSQQLWHVEMVRNTSVEYYWLDAGWFNGGFPGGVGNWQIPIDRTVLRSCYPNGTLAPLADACHKSPSSVGFIVWFEPERVAPHTYIASTFPEYVLGQSNPSAEGLLNLGDDEARTYMHDYLSAAVEAYSLDVLRLDFNIAPGPIWSAADEVNRSGIVEARYVDGLYKLWDTILEGHPGLMIDDCSSGGRRIDLETLSRSFPLWRSDYGAPGDMESLQSMTMGLSLFAPVSSGAVWGWDPYRWRSGLTYSNHTTHTQYMYTKHNHTVYS
eukprot:m.118940 g.118940  ORF g.118940 m.118940 type:complete len:363 (+) comp14297_c0_seq3:988-2076(+)